MSGLCETFVICGEDVSGAVGVAGETRENGVDLWLGGVVREGVVFFNVVDKSLCATVGDSVGEAGLVGHGLHRECLVEDVDDGVDDAAGAFVFEFLVEVGASVGAQTVSEEFDVVDLSGK